MRLLSVSVAEGARAEGIVDLSCPQSVIVMEFCGGGDLLGWIQAHGAVSEPTARIWSRQMMDALSVSFSRLSSRSSTHALSPTVHTQEGHFSS